MDKSSIEIGKTFTTAKSSVTGEVKEVIKNANGSLRVRLDVAGQDRWTTVKQFTASDLGMSRLNYLPFKICECNKTANGFLFRSKLTSSLQTLSSADWDSLNEDVWQGSQIPLTKT